MRWRATGGYPPRPGGYTLRTPPAADGLGRTWEEGRQVYIEDRTSRATDRARHIRAAAPGLLAAAAAAVAGYAVNRVAGSAASPVVVAVVLGILVRGLGGYHARLRDGLTFASRTLLRAGVVPLGLQLAVSDVRQLGVGAVAVILLSVGTAFVVTRWCGRLLGLSPARALLIATGVSICGASAVAAMKQVSDGDEEDVVTAVAVVTVLGTLCLAALPALGMLLGLDETTLGLWAGTSVHEVGQVVAIGGMAGAAALTVAVVAKLCRVLLLAPLVAVVAATRRDAAGARPPVLPWFVVGFMAMVAVRSTGLLPDAVLHDAATASGLMLAAAMFALGTAVDLSSVARGGWRALSAGVLGTVVLAGVSLTGLVLIG
ncbi:putative sulfate exporter family transporter [Dactylosporangium sp. NPDC051484]|uniref:YeiH family protein n=1 Tax=Dactylosporangium sp. NPDC051484 TaxID=3154942 RepID=UPI00344E5368